MKFVNKNTKVRNILQGIIILKEHFILNLTRMPFDINDYNLEDIFTFNEMYAYMCKTKRHENSQYQQIFEGQREHLEPNYLPKQILRILARQGLNLNLD